jgi:predicted phosphodiesterase
MIATLLVLSVLGEMQLVTKAPSVHAVTDHSAVLDTHITRQGDLPFVIISPDGGERGGELAEPQPINGLEPDTHYDYAIGNPKQAVYGSFTTAPKPGSLTPFTFAVVGDSRDHGKWSELAHAIAATKPRFVLTTGDYVQEPASEKDWNDYYRAGFELFASVPVFAVMGNHDVGPLYDRYNPAPKSSSGSTKFYSFTYGNAAFVAIDSNQVDAQQRAWLAQELPRLSGGPLFVFQHHPLYSCGQHGSSPPLQETLQPLFEQAHVTADFAGHDHDLIAWKPVHGVRYFVSGGGGTHLYGLHRCAETAFSREGFGFMLVTVAGAQITARFLDGHGVELSKSAFTAASERLPVRAAP